MLNRGLHPAAFVLCLGLVISTGAFFMVQHRYRAEAQNEFQGLAAEFTVAVSQSLQRYLEVVKSVGSFFAASKEVDRWEFFEFARDSLPRYPAVEALTWVPRVPAAARAAYEQRAQEDGLFGFRFRVPDGRDKEILAAVRDEHFPVYYVEPYEGNERELGLDLASSLKDLRTLHEARDTGRMVIARHATGMTSGAGPELAVVLPVYRSGKIPRTREEKRDGLLGFARAVLRLPKLIEAALLSHAAPPGLDIYIYDEGAEPGQRLVTYHPSPLRRTASASLPEDEVRDGLFAATRHRIAGRDWSIVVKPVNHPLDASINRAAWGVLEIGLFLTLLLVQYLVSLHNRTRVIEYAVTERTAELRATNAALETEIRERERVEQELRAAKERAEVAGRAKSEFLGMMSHELRTPLNAVIGFSELLCNESFGPLGSERYRSYADTIRSSGTDLLARITDILELTEIDPEDVTLHEERLSLAETFEAVLPMIREKVAAAELKLSATFEPNLPALNADPRAIKQILLNLLANAVKFTPAGGQITVRAAPDDEGHFCLDVSDTGIGIQRQHLALALQPFSQIDSSLSRRYDGMGLGLALTHRLVQMHGGKLEIDSEMGVGTTVRVVFPKERVLPHISAGEVA